MAHDDKRRPQSPATEPELKPEASQQVSEPKSGSAAARVQRRAASPLDRRFDMWLEKQLQAMYEVEPTSSPRSFRG